MERKIDTDPLNAIIGNKSFLHVNNRHPTSKDTEQNRITLHLTYVLHLLRAKNINFPGRNTVLDFLEEYISIGLYPYNVDFPEGRRPCFIDAFGNYCAVGYLMKRMNGEAFARKVDEMYHHEYVMKMDNPDVVRWIQMSGLTKEECAMIQPGYSFQDCSPFTRTFLVINLMAYVYLAIHTIVLSYNIPDSYPAELKFYTSSGYFYVIAFIALLLSLLSMSRKRWFVTNIPFRINCILQTLLNVCTIGMAIYGSIVVFTGDILSNNELSPFIITHIILLYITTFFASIATIPVILLGCMFWNTTTSPFVPRDEEQLQSSYPRRKLVRTYDYA